MPSTYAHYRMGEQVRKMLSPEIQNIINQHQALYRIGLHGPDPFFYYNPVFPNVVNQIGNENHEISGRDFVERASKVIMSHEEDPGYQAYFYGVLTHFALDAACHGYVAEKMERSGISHTEVEVEFDRYLMVLDGKEPLSYVLTKHISVTKENARVLADFYPGIDRDTALRSLRDFVFYHRILRCPGKLKRQILFSLMKLSGTYDSLHGHVVNRKPNPDCVDSNKELHKLYKAGRKNAATLINEFRCDTPYSAETDAILSLNFECKFV